jgi:hypothetical protein
MRALGTVSLSRINGHVLANLDNIWEIDSFPLSHLPNACMQLATGLRIQNADNKRKVEIKTLLNISEACANNTGMLVKEYVVSCRTNNIS